ncbi:GNAT family N-acetyltransferase [Paractinoplanes ferrugineus]|uniref:N-acetyltransferase n=1 Tax=Paractinoplanes ferrugineus TaxID=113564 RepID=A0A919MP91_9ACTN|nr:GNAT family N-acetyltransferase [Actinoplanes ferrugineus]GIE15062.1 N-acetyltransferase [Actinoplanes ferrugineus]
MPQIIREFQESDWPPVRAIVDEVVRAGETFTYDQDMTPEQVRAIWLAAPPGRTTVAVAGEQMLGTAKMGANRGGPGAHIATASFMVAALARGRGVGTALCRDALEWARAEGYAGMQFNAVVETNRAAVRIYENLGFRVLGTVPRAFEHPTLGRVGLHLMYHEFGA